MTASAAPAPSKVDTGRVNPYVGPRSLRRGEEIYGRDVEIREVRAALLAHRIVLLYSQSGAGKTSLIEAGLRPQLEEREFQVFPTIRVSFEAPEGAPPDANRYRMSVLASLEEARPPELQLTVDELAGMSLDDYFQRLDDELPDRDPCLIFDQFEELFTLDPVDWEDKEAFLRELGTALSDRGRWALFSMREDFIAQLDPYLGLIPTGFNTRYRIDLLGPAAAKEAITRPAEDMGVDFTDEAADLLIDDLRRVNVQRGHETVSELGPSVEPVQLQVVCNRLWARLPEGATSIGPNEARAAGDVNKALAEFYDVQVKVAASGTKTREREIRRWFEYMLITPDGFRTQVRTGPGRSAGNVLRSLENSHVIRSDRIRGAQWYELSHDRFVEPVRASNAAFTRQKRRRGWGIALAALGGVIVLLFVGTRTDQQISTIPPDTDVVAIGFDQKQDGMIAKPGDQIAYTFEADDGDTVLAMLVTPGFNPEVELRGPDGQWLAGAAGFFDSREPWLVAAQGLTAGQHTALVKATSSSTGGFEFTLQRPQVTTVAEGASTPGSITAAAPVGVHRFALSQVDPVVVNVLPGANLNASVGVLGPDGGFVSSGLGSSDQPAAILLPTPEDGSYLITVTGIDSSVGAYDVGMEPPMAPWDFVALLPLADEIGLGPSDYFINIGGTSINCVDWNRDALIAEEAVRLTPQGFDDHGTWAWTARFSAPDGVKSYLDSFGSDGCRFPTDNGTRVIFAPSPLSDEAVWYITAVQDANGDTTLESVGVIATTDRMVVEVQVWLHGRDGFYIPLQVDPSRPYGNEAARVIAEEVVDEATRVLREMSSG